MNFTGGQKKLLTHQEFYISYYRVQIRCFTKDLFRPKRTCSSNAPSQMYTNHYPLKTNDRRQVISSVWNVKKIIIFCDLLMLNRKKSFIAKRGKVQNKNNVGVVYPEKGRGLVKDCGRWMVAPVCSWRVDRRTLHAITKAWLRGWLSVARRRLVSVAVGLLRRHRNIGARCQHQLWCAINNGLRLCSLLFLFSQRLRGFKFVDLAEVFSHDLDEIWHRKVHDVVPPRGLQHHIWPQEVIAREEAGSKTLFLVLL